RQALPCVRKPLAAAPGRADNRPPGAGDPPPRPVRYAGAGYLIYYIGLGLAAALSGPSHTAKAHAS
ncbi:hypothetical protein KGQ19_46985, partial [Catenulispora sp. NL8]